MKSKPEAKKRGRKRKSETAAEASKQSFEEPEFIVPDAPVVEKKTRSGRISKPRKNDDMVRPFKEILVFTLREPGCTAITVHALENQLN